MRLSNSRANSRLAFGRAAPIPTEHQSQVAFMQWWASWCRTAGIPEQLCFAVPNGGQRSRGVAGKMKAEGVKKGVADVFLSVPMAGFHGLYLEFKRPGGRPTVEQEAFLYEVRRRGYNALVVWSTLEAIQAVKEYLKPPTK